MTNPLRCSPVPTLLLLQPDSMPKYKEVQQESIDTSLYMHPRAGA